MLKMYKYLSISFQISNKQFKSQNNFQVKMSSSSSSSSSIMESIMQAVNSDIHDKLVRISSKFGIALNELQECVNVEVREVKAIVSVSKESEAVKRVVVSKEDRDKKAHELASKKALKDADIQAKKEQKEAVESEKKALKDAEIQAKKALKDAEIQAKKALKEADIQAKKEEKDAEKKALKDKKKAVVDVNEVSDLFANMVLDTGVCAEAVEEDVCSESGTVLMSESESESESESVSVSKKSKKERAKKAAEDMLVSLPKMDVSDGNTDELASKKAQELCAKKALKEQELSAKKALKEQELSAKKALKEQELCAKKALLASKKSELSAKKAELLSIPVITVVAVAVTEAVAVAVVESEIDAPKKKTSGKRREINGVKYIITPTNLVYSEESRELVGTWSEKTQMITPTDESDDENEEEEV